LGELELGKHDWANLYWAKDYCIQSRQCSGSSNKSGDKFEVPLSLHARQMKTQGSYGSTDSVIEDFCLQQNIRIVL